MVKCSFNNMLLFSFCILSSSFLYAMDKKPLMRGSQFHLQPGDLTPTKALGGRIQEIFNPTTQLQEPKNINSTDIVPFHKAIIINQNPNDYTNEFTHSADAANYNGKINNKTKHITINMGNGKAFTGQGLTGLHLAALLGQNKIFNYLYSNGANPTILDNDNTSIWHYIAIGNSTNIFWFLLEKTIEFLLSNNPQQKEFGKVLLSQIISKDNCGQTPESCSPNGSNLQSLFKIIQPKKTYFIASNIANTLSKKQQRLIFWIRVF